MKKLESTATLDFVDRSGQVSSCTQSDRPVSAEECSVRVGSVRQDVR